MSFEVNDLTCTISREIMSNPVELGCKHNFEKKALTTWFAEGKDTCPLDQGVVDENAITYNDELRAKVEVYVGDHPECLEAGQLKAIDKDLKKIKATLIHSHELIAIQAQEAAQREVRAQRVERLNEVIVQRIIIRNDIQAQNDREVDQRCAKYATCFAIFMIVMLLIGNHNRD